MLDIRENQLTSFSSFPKSAKLETVLLSFNFISDLAGFSNCPNIVTFDLKNNKLKVLTDEIFTLKGMKNLDLSNNDLQSLPFELGLLKNLSKLQIEGNPLRSIRIAIRTGGTEVIKKYLVSRINVDADQNSLQDQQDLKGNLVKEEFGTKEGKTSKLVALVRELKNTNGDLDLRGQGLSSAEITEDILKAEKVRLLDLSGNKLDRFPNWIEKLGPVSLKMNNNVIDKVDGRTLLLFSTLKDLELRSNKLASFGDGFLNSSEQQLMQINFSNLTYLDLSQNNLVRVPSVLHEFKLLKNLVISFNSISQLTDLFIPGSLASLEQLDVSNNGLADIPPIIYKWQRLHSLNVSNNNIKNFPGELGLLDLKSFTIIGNPSVLIKNNTASKGIPFLLNYLKEKVANLPLLEREVADIRSKHQVFATLPKKPKDLVEYDYQDPFKKKATQYNKQQEQRYGEVYEEDVVDQLKSKTQSGSPMEEERRRDYNPRDYAPNNETLQKKADPYRREELPGYNYNTEVKAPTRQNPYKMDEEPLKKQFNPNELKELESKMRYLQDKVDNDFSLNKNKIADMRKEIAALKIQRAALLSNN